MPWYLALLLLFLSACRPCSSPNLCFPEEYEQKGAMEEPPVPLCDFWSQFDDPQLTELVERGLSCNLDLRIAVERICEARGFFTLERSKLLPHIDGFGLLNRMRNSETLSEAPFTGGTYTNYFQTGFDAHWELDLFGKNLDRMIAAGLNVGEQQELMRDLHVSIASEVARAYFIIRALQERIEVTLQHIHSERDLYILVKSRFDAGLIPELDVYTAKALLETRMATLPHLQKDLQLTIYSLAVLLGQIPEVITPCFDDVKPIPFTDRRIPLGFPSDLLCQRGDVRAAELAMRASGARVLAARKELFPTISLDGLYSWATGFWTEWFKTGSRHWDLVPGLRLPLFRGGEILSHIAIETSLQRQHVLIYEKAVLEALQEVESSLVSYFKEEERIAALKETVTSYTEARTLAQTLYFAGLVDFLYVLDTERDLYIAENVLIDSKEQLMSNYVAIYKSIGGGGWECFTSPSR